MVIFSRSKIWDSLSLSSVVFLVFDLCLVQRDASMRETEIGTLLPGSFSVSLVDLLHPPSCATFGNFLSQSESLFPIHKMG